jgi:hypothetical protein
MFKIILFLIRSWIGPIILVIIASLMTAAHFFRHYNYPLMAISLLVPFLLLIKKRWVLTVIQLLALAGAGVWINTIVVIARMRMHYGEPWKRMAVILGAVALFTAGSGLLLNLKKVRDKYPTGDKETSSPLTGGDKGEGENKL